MAFDPLLCPTGTEPKSRAVGESPAPGSTPTPLSGTFCGLSGASSVTTTLPVLLPAVSGEKKTLIVQLACGASVAPQLVNFAKLPPATILLIFSAALPWLVM